MTRTRTISNNDDIIDSRDVIARIEELEGERDNAKAEAESAPEDAEDSWTTNDGTLVHATWTESDEDKYQALRAFASEGENCADWADGVRMIRDSYFETYAEQLAEDIGMINGREGWPLTCIDWERAARELQYDYTSAEFDGVTYWGRS